MPKRLKELLEAAHQAVPVHAPPAARQLHAEGKAVFIDVRETGELAREGKIPGAVHVPRGMLEFLIDRDSPYHHAAFSQDADFVFYCAGGGRSALAAQRAAEMGLRSANLQGGFTGWREAGGPVEPA